eukprot:gene6291-4527_t
MFISIHFMYIDENRIILSIPFSVVFFSVTSFRRIFECLNSTRLEVVLLALDIYALFRDYNLIFYSPFFFPFWMLVPLQLLIQHSIASLLGARKPPSPLCFYSSFARQDELFANTLISDFSSLIFISVDLFNYSLIN